MNVTEWVVVVELVAVVELELELLNRKAYICCQSQNRGFETRGIHHNHCNWTQRMALEESWAMED